MKIGIIGGSGLYNLDDSSACEVLKVSTPFGSPSDDIVRKPTREHELFFLPRHGKGHRFLPSEINYRANIFALKQLGCRAVLSISAVGSLKREIHPGDFVLPDQYIDFTKGLRPHTFFGEGIVGHVNFSKPTSFPLGRHLEGLIRRIGVRCHVGGIYVCIEGPQFSSQAESFLYRSFQLGANKVDIIGMTALPEAKLAREAGLHYQTVGMATDYDCWHEEHDVKVEDILKVLNQNINISKSLIQRLGEETLEEHHFPNLSARTSVITPEEFWPENKKAMMETLLA